MDDRMKPIYGIARWDADVLQHRAIDTCSGYIAVLNAKL